MDRTYHPDLLKNERRISRPPVLPPTEPPTKARTPLLPGRRGNVLQLVASCHTRPPAILMSKIIRPRYSSNNDTSPASPIFITINFYFWDLKRLMAHNTVIAFGGR